MALAGHDTLIQVINDPGTKSTYSGTLAGVVAGELIEVSITACSDSGTNTPSSWTVTLGPDTLAHRVGRASSGVWGIAAIFWVVATTSGDQTLTVQTVNACRALSAHARRITGFNTSGPIAASGLADSYNQNATALTTPNGVTTLADGNCVIGCLGVNGGAATGMAVTGADGSTPGQSGTNTNNDHSYCHAHKLTPTAAAVTFAYSWSGGATSPRPAAVWVEIAAATGAPTIDLAGGTASATDGAVDLPAGGSVDLSGATSSAADGGLDLVNPAANDIQLSGSTVAATDGGLDLIAAGTVDLAGAAAGATSGDLTLPPSGVTQPLALTPMPFDGYVFDSPDGLVAPVTISGQGTTGDTIQVRGASAGGNTAWHPAVVDVAGDWTVTFDVPVDEWANWYQPEARIGTDDLTKITDAAVFGCGHVVGIMGQSEPEYILATAGAFNGLAYPALDAENITIITDGAAGGITPRRIDATGVGVVNVAMVAIANALAHIRGDRKVMIFDLCESGTSRIALANDANAGRSWTDFDAMIATVRAGGSDVGAIIDCWYNADAATIDNFMTEWAPFYFGQRAGGGAFTLGTPNPDSTRNPSANVDHCLWDIEAASGDRGRGIFARGRTKLHLMTPMPFHDTLGTEQRNFNCDASGATISNRINQLDRPARDQVMAFAADSRVQSFLGAVGPSAHVVDFNGGIHPVTDSEWGTPQFAMCFLPSILRATGYAVGEPTITGTEAANDGSYVDVIVDLPNGGNLTTLRTFEGIAAPGTEPPHYQQVGGFEIRRAADGDNARRPVMKLTETSYPANYRGTVTIVDSGTGTAPARTGRVRITPENAFATGDRLEYLRGEANGHILQSRDVAAQLFLDQIIEHVPALYDAAATFPMRGVPVRPQPATLTISITPAITLAGETVAAVSGGVDLPAAGTIDLTGSTVAATDGGVDLVDPAANDIAITGETAGVASGGLDLVAVGTIDLGGAAVGITMGGVDLAASGSIDLGGVTVSVAMGAIDIAAPGAAPRRVALASESRNGVIILTPVNGAVIAREIIGANDVLDMSGHPIIDMTNSALLGMTG